MRLLTSRQARYSSLLGIALAVLIGCSSSREDSPPEPPPQSTPTVTDPATAARIERVRQSLEQGLDVNKTDADGRTALMMAAFEGYTVVVELLLDNGAEVDFADGVGRTAIMYASSGPFPQTVDLLARNGADVNRIDLAEGWTALMFAAAEGQQAVVEVLARHGADLELTDQDGDAAVDHARARGQVHIVTLLESL
jgi:ankyrin repeat protein